MIENCKTVSITIQRNADAVYAYLSHPPNLSLWSAFLNELKADGDAWIATTPEGSVRVRFAPMNEYRVVDHWVTVDADLTVYVPMRVLERDAESSEVIFTIFRLPGMSDDQFANDVAMVTADLANLKRVLEA